MRHPISQQAITILELIGTLLLFIFGQGIVLPSPIPTIFNIASYAILFLLIIGRWKHFAYVATKDKSLLLLVVFCAASIFWSADVSSTAENVKGMLRTTLFGAYLAMRYTPKEQMRLLSWVFSIIMVLSLAAATLIPSYGTHVINGVLSWRGVFDHKQMLGRVMGFAASFFLITLLDRRSNRWIAGICMIFAILLLKLSNSATGLIVFVFSLLLLPLYQIVKQRGHRVVSLTIILLLSTVVAVGITVNLKTILVDGLGKDTKFNGRIPIWEHSIEKGLEKPFFGYGYHGFWSSDAADYVISHTWLGAPEEGSKDVEFGQQQKAGLSHNGFLDLFLQLGLVGLLLFILNLSFLLIRVLILVFSTRSIEYFWMFVFLGVKVVSNISDSPTILEPNSIFWITYVSIAISSSLELSRFRRKQQQTQYSNNLEVTV